jgi:4-amino-4-deoxy-L-arabinose transferase-like glycosyltransferase
MLIVTIGIIATFLHIYKLTTLPVALNVDEAGLWYNVRCLLNWGIDQKGNSWPVLFANIWGEQSPAYAYLAFICCKIFGESLFAIRLPAVFNTLLVMIFGCLNVDKLFKSKKINLVYLCLFTITPYFTIISKMALDCNLMLGFSTVFLYCFLHSLETKNIKWYVITGIVCGLTFYTYALSYLMIPVFLVFSLVYLVAFKKVTLKEILAFFIPVI